MYKTANQHYEIELEIVTNYKDAIDKFIHKE